MTLVLRLLFPQVKVLPRIDCVISNCDRVSGQNTVVCAGVFGSWSLLVSPSVGAACTAGGIACVSLIDNYVCKKLPRDPDPNDPNSCNPQPTTAMVDQFP
jgi:hypothetical protein